MKYNLLKFPLILCCFLFSVSVFAQFPTIDPLRRAGTGNSGFGQPLPETPRKARAAGNKLFAEKQDTVKVIIPDSLKSKDNSLQSIVKYTAQDSTVMEVDGRTVHLYGQAKVTYGDIALEADYIRLDWGKNEIFAHGSPDTTKKGEKVKGKPVFTQAGDTYNTDTIRYNFKSRKAIIKNIVTRQGEGFVQGERVKKDPEDNLYLVHAKYTTCNLKEPHFHIAARKIKLVNKKQIISGPFNFVLSGVPLPLGLPFGFFPVPKKKEIGTSGIIMGSYGEEPRNRGFYFRDFGYYFAISENIGAKVLAQIYSKGSFGVGVQSSYSKRYKYSGNLSFQYNYNKPVAEVIDPKTTQSSAKDFSLNWSHSPANKRPDRSFSSSVNLRSNGFNRNNVNTADVSNYLSSTSNSSVQYNRTFAQKFVTSTGLNISQNFTTGQVDANLNYSLGLNQFNPFIPEKKMVGRWFESFRVGFNVNGGYQATNTKVNSITSYSEYKIVRQLPDGSYESIEAKPLTNEEIRLRDANPLTLTPAEREKQKAIQERLNNVRKINSLNAFQDILSDGQFRTTYSIPIVLPNFKIARYINFTPSVSLRGDIFTQSLRYQYIESQNAVKIDTIKGFFPTYQTSVSGSINTRVYGTYQFRGKGRLQAIRHTLAPSISVNYAPDFTKNLFDYMVVRIDQDTVNGVINRTRLNKLLPRYPTLGASAGASGSIGFSLTNQLEAKVRSRSDTAAKAFEKISLLDNLGISGSYNLLAIGDSMNLSNINISANTNLLKNLININVSGSLDPYYYRQEATSALQLQNPAGRITRFYKISQADKFSLSNLATLRNANVAIATRLSPATFDKSKEKPKEMRSTDPAMEAMKKFVATNPELYVDFSIPWTLSVSYNLNYIKQGLANPQITQAVTVQGDLSLTPKWKIGFNTGWDFQFKAATLTNISLHRELHCWDMSFNWTPIAGNNIRSSNYSFDLRVRSTLLQELKLSRRRQTYGLGGF
ncbi:putative LPS assembly protein LptD [Emticicia sp. 21SJ11W-3]|uniref:putative LPS assembly protein LptD n=1 Tax=Emticicia sp. 21SJ11W-3 TaxID=2916755 RepID=UPI0020A02DA6|nr:putative LPS assembly protein LptD [Emticicia sp. 21SJ11W-3]UTA69269.1 LPS-assembly protein LptD [Emticicia sp. 21SJ11W-3]